MVDGDGGGDGGVGGEEGTSTRSPTREEDPAIEAEVCVKDGDGDVEDKAVVVEVDATGGISKAVGGGSPATRQASRKRRVSAARRSDKVARVAR